MAQMSDFRQPLPQKGMPGRRAVGKAKEFRTTQIENELQFIEMEITRAANKSRQLAEDLGRRYTVFRSECRPCDTGVEIRDMEILRLSRETDKCIETVYSLEKRRRDLLDKIGR